MTYRTCIGCISEKQPCQARDKLRATLKGLGVTSIKWKCRARWPRFEVGDPVWALTVANTSGGEVDDDGQALRDYFPAVAIRACGTKMLVRIEPGAAGRGDFGDGVKFDPTHSGYCKIPLSRISAREGEREQVCRYCEWPASKGHAPGYSCNPDPRTDQ